MGRIFLVHWNADELDERVARLERAGHTVTASSEHGGGAARRLAKGKLPDAVVIDLGRLPSHGKHMAVWLRDNNKTRHLPIVFVCGDPAKVSGVAERFPDAVFTPWSRVRGALTRATKNPPKTSPKASPTTGYSGTPLPKKLGVKADSIVALLSAPKDFETTLGTLPEGATIRRQARGQCDVLVLFCRSCADLEKRLPTTIRCLGQGGGLWIAWPKKASGVATDLSDRFVREAGLATGLVDTKVCAIDATWSGLKFMRRTKSAR